jgi:RNA polymerase sigma factor (sigma-70 family)
VTRDYRAVTVPEPAVEHPASRGTREEADLVRRAQLGSAAAFEQLVLLRGPALHRFLSVRLRDDAEALDALQETLVAAWLGLPGLRDPTRVWPWLCGIAVRKAADAARSRKAVGARLASPSSTSDDSLLELREAVAALPERFRRVLLLRYLLGLSEEEVADALEIRVGTVKSRAARARKAFREAWE